MERRRSTVAILVVTAVLITGACSGAPADKPGASPTPATPITLRIGTDDEPDRPSTDQINHFAAEVKRISNDQLVIEPVWHAAGDDQDNWDQAVARLVVAGDLDMGMIPARAWDTEGVTTLRALQAPFLITSNDLVGKVVTADLADEMLAGLDKADITGLALVPESLREIFSFGKPFLSVRDFKGTTIRTPRSDTSSKVFKALGATADDLVDADGNKFDQGVADGTVAAAESSFRLASFSAPTTATANLVPYPKINSLVINEAKFGQLSQGQQDILRQAAIETRDWGVKVMADPDQEATRFCEEGGTVVNATEKNLAAIRAATQTVYTDLEKDPETKSFIDRIRDLKANSAAPTPVAACKP